MRPLLVGFDENHNPARAGIGTAKANNMLISGASGYGKGVLIQILCSSALISDPNLDNNSAVILFDGKRCREQYSTVLLQAKRLGRPFITIDLLAQVPQINLFRGKSVDDIVQIISSVVDLELRGQESDVYKTQEKQVLRRFANFIVQQTKSAPFDDLLSTFLVQEPGLCKKAPKLMGQLQELMFPVICAEQGLDLNSVIEQGAVIFIEGSVSNPSVIVLQKLILAWVTNFLELRDRTSSRRLLMVLDEYAASLASKTSISLSRVARAYNASIVYVTQNAAADLREVDDISLDPEVAEQTLLTNCGLKFQYRANTIETARYFSELSGTIRGHEESIKTELSLFGREYPTGQIQLTEVELPLISENELLSLPNGVGYLFESGKPPLKVYVRPLPLPHLVEAIPTDFGETYPYTQGEASSAEDLI